MQNKTVLVIDDSMTDFLYVKNILSHGGYEVAYAQSAKQGIDEAKKIQPACILMDVVMPGMNGFQATRRLNQNTATKKIPIVIVSTKDQETDKVWAKRQGAIEYITKPTKEKPLMSCVNELLSA